MTWTCSRCCQGLMLHAIGVRFRFSKESCPRCSDPGNGMELISDKEHTK